ncbi:MAG: PEP-CTERM sorting domain-containing protein [Sedimentisphaerales bacterium]|nr:PEP-CTERM sorting domain-containing protein [Sedimentisphaerales bacterium]
MFKKKILICLMVVLLSGTYLALADTGWDSGHHYILDGETYGEIWMYNDATADMLGGYVYQLGALDSSRFNMFAGTMDILMVRYNSIVNIYGGTLGSLNVYLDENGLVNLYAYDVAYHPTGGGYYHDCPWMGGKYIGNDQDFAFVLSPAATSHINIIPEPTTLLLLGTGLISLLARDKRIARIS